MYNPYPTFNNPYAPQQYGAQGALTKTEVTRVNGRNGAETYQLPSNSSVLLLDTSAPIVWLKTTDGAGYPSLQPYGITPMKETNHMQSIEDRLTRLEEIVNAKSDSRSNKPEQSNVKDRERTAAD
jgi:hypothetical protein